MDDIHIEPQRRVIDSSDRPQGDAGGGMSFVFYDGGHPGEGEEEEQKKKKKDIDFGEPVELELSSKALGQSDDTASDEASSNQVDNKPDDDDSSPRGHHINITI